ncbi:S-layer homology domain-containing protein [Nitriliruptor alkaliphilus]|uniref:S-layer homology domain-containing protein n=1 Tax=Nitriliruptor alkaliphilus TaxID=427918 RepID=UPI000696D68D|nr:S-layer homology domain-containing protein [Nitriliruptor alkaliphilus]
MPRTAVTGLLVAALTLGLVTTAAPAPATAAPSPRDIGRACPALDLSVSPFGDVAGTHVPGVACVARWGVTQGVTATRFAPHTAVTREQVGSFLARSLDTAGGRLRPTVERAFADTRGSVHRDAVDRLADAGIVTGVGGRFFDPRRPVRRDQMATMLVRAYEHLLRDELPAGPNPFRDTGGNTHERNIIKAVRAGFTVGAEPGRYDPAGTVSRQQMATFVSRMLAAAVEDLGVRAPDDGRPGPYFVDTFGRDANFLLTNGTLSYSSTGGRTDSPIFRLTSRRRDFQDVRITLDFQHLGFVTGPTTPARDWDGVNVWIRHRSQFSLYYATFNRRDGRITLKKKEPRPHDPANNYGRYHTLAVGELSFRQGSDQRMSVEAENVGRGRVELRVRNAAGKVVLSALDDGSVGGPALTTPGATGVRGDNSRLLLQRLEVSPL